MIWPFSLLSRNKAAPTALATATPAIPAIEDRAFRRIPGIDFPISAPQPMDIPLIGHSHWSVAQVQTALDGIKVGSLIWAHQLMLEMQEDPVFSAGLDLRTKSLVETEFTLEKPKVATSEEYERAFDCLQANWHEVFNENDLAQSSKYRVTLGLAPASVNWFVRDRYWLPEIRIKETGNVIWYQYENRFKFTSLDQGLLTIENDGNEWVLFCELASKYPYLDGAIRPLAVWWWIKQAVARYEHNFARVNGQPIKKIKCPAPQREERDFRDLLLQAQSLQNNGIFAAPVYEDGLSFDIELVETKGEGVVFDKLLDRADDAITLKLLGGIENTRGGKGGSKARAETHQLQSNKFLKADCMVTGAALRKVLKWWCVYNRFPVEWMPVPRFHSDPPKDEKESAEARNYSAQALSKLFETLPAWEAKLKAQVPGASIDYCKILQDSEIEIILPGEQKVDIT